MRVVQLLDFQKVIVLSSILVFSPTLTSLVSAQSLLHEVRGNGMKHSVYIYGTIHAIAQSDFFIDAVVDDRFNDSDIIVFEVDISSPTIMAEVQSAMMMKEYGLDSLINEEDYQRVKRFFADSLQLPLDMLKQVKPLMMSSFLLPKLIGYQSVSYETFFLQRAIEQQKKVKGLETVAEQIGYMDMIPLESQAKILMETIEDFNVSRKEFVKLVETYKTRDVEKVYEVVMETGLEYREFGQYLIDARNQNWVPRIIELGNNANTFIAIGCGHLGGESGVLNLLRKQGFEVIELLSY
jgi:uncharacterized protein YbaP (TraB family)